MVLKFIFPPNWTRKSAGRMCIRVEGRGEKWREEVVLNLGAWQAFQSLSSGNCCSNLKSTEEATQGQGAGQSTQQESGSRLTNRSGSEIMSLHKAFTGLDSRKQGKDSSKVVNLKLELSEL